MKISGVQCKQMQPSVIIRSCVGFQRTTCSD